MHEIAEILQELGLRIIHAKEDLVTATNGEKYIVVIRVAENKYYITTTEKTATTTKQKIRQKIEEMLKQNP